MLIYSRSRIHSQSVSNLKPAFVCERDKNRMVLDINRDPQTSIRRVAGLSGNTEQLYC
jgi:hypothetical protein